jgi:hypothetical protein
MSIQLLIQDLEAGNFTGAEKRLADWWAGMPSWLQAFVAKAKTAEGQILTGLVETAAVDVASGGFTTASFVSAGKDVLAKAEAQELGFSQQEVMSALNLAANALKPVAAPTADPSPAPSDPQPASPPSA